MSLIKKEAPTNFVPAVAVIRRELVLLKMTGRKGLVGIFVAEIFAKYLVIN